MQRVGWVTDTLSGQVSFHCPEAVVRTIVTVSYIVTADSAEGQDTSMKLILEGVWSLHSARQTSCISRLSTSESYGFNPRRLVIRMCRNFWPTSSHHCSLVQDSNCRTHPKDR